MGVCRNRLEGWDDALPFTAVVSQGFMRGVCRCVSVSVGAQPCGSAGCCCTSGKQASDN